MIRSVKSTMLSAALLAAIAGGAYAAEQQLPYSTPNYGPKVSGWNNTPTTHWQNPAGYAAEQQLPYSTPNYGPKASSWNNTPTTHWQKPAGYDQDPAMHPYTRDGALKPS